VASFSKVVNGLRLTDPVSGEVFNFNIHKAEEGLSARIRTVPWEPGMPVTPWVKDLFPFSAGWARTKELNPGGLSLQPLNPTDTFHPEVVFPGPAVTAITVTSALLQCTKFIQAKDNAGTAVFGISGRWLHRFSSAFAVTSTDLGAAIIATDIVQINGDIIICCGSTGFIRRRSAAAAINISADVYAHSMVIVRDRIWKVRNSNAAVNNVLSYLVGLNATDASALTTLSNWTTTTPPYLAGDSTYQATMLYDNGGTLAAGRTDGIFMPDPEYKFLNVTPQIARAPDFSGETGKGCWSAFGYFFVPYHRGLLRLSPGFAEDVGPGTMYLPKTGLRVRAGLEWDRMMYVLMTDERTFVTYLVKMIPDRADIADGEYIYQPVAYIAASASHYGRAMTMFTAPTNPTLVFGGGAAATSANRITLGRGSGRDVDDANYLTVTGDSYLTTGLFTPAADASMVATLVSAKGYVGATAGATTPINFYYSASQSQMPGDAPSTLMETAVGSGVGEITTVGESTRYAARNSQGRFFNLQAKLTSVGTLNPALLAWRAQGYFNPAVTDEITLTLDGKPFASLMGNRAAASHHPNTILEQLRLWCKNGTVINGMLEGYAEERNVSASTLSFMVKSVSQATQSSTPGGQGTRVHVPVIELVLVRVDYSAEYGAAG
jgi:hypothetical protein